MTNCAYFDPQDKILVLSMSFTNMTIYVPITISQLNKQFTTIYYYYYYYYYYYLIKILLKLSFALLKKKIHEALILPDSHPNPL